MAGDTVPGDTVPGDAMAGHTVPGDQPGPEPRVRQDIDARRDAAWVSTGRRGFWTRILSPAAGGS
jgi:hypothetical protein